MLKQGGLKKYSIVFYLTVGVISDSVNRNSYNLNVRNNVPNRTAVMKLRAYVAELIISDYMAAIRKDKADNVSNLRNECLLPIND